MCLRVAGLNPSLPEAQAFYHIGFLIYPPDLKYFKFKMHSNKCSTKKIPAGFFKFGAF